MPVWKQLFVLLVLAGLGFGAYKGYRVYLAPPAEAEAGDAGPRAVSVETATAERRKLARTVEAVGTTRARRSVQIVPLAAGRVVAVNFRPGQQVAAGDVLVELDDDIERADVAEAEAHAGPSSTRPSIAPASCSRAAPSPGPSSSRSSPQVAAAEAALDRARRRLADRRSARPSTASSG